MKTHSLLLLTLLYRDFFAYRTRLPKQILNWIFIYPLLYGFTFACIQGPAYFKTYTVIKTTELFAGSLLLLINGFTFDNTINLLEDLTGLQHINFLRLACPLWLDLLRRVLVPMILCLLLLSAYLPVAKIVTGSLVDTSCTNWIQLMVIITAGAFYASSMHLLSASILRNADSSMMSYWCRFLLPLCTLGGYWVPVYAFANLHPLLTGLAYINPYTYITEGIRYAVLQEPRFIHVYTCSGVLLFSGIVLFLLAYQTLYKRIDHVGR